MWLGVGSALLLSACGVPYPSDPDKWMPDFGIEGDHGAIAIRTDYSAAALTARYISQDAANEAALERCGTGCKVVLKFEGDELCGALAAGSNKQIGLATGRPEAAAEASALAKCEEAGGQNCEIKLSGCND